MKIRYAAIAALVILASAPHQAFSQNFLESMFKSAAEGMAKSAVDNAAAKAGVPMGIPVGGEVATPFSAFQPAQVQVLGQAQVVGQAQAPHAGIPDPGCKKGQLINPDHVMLQANLLPDASLADNPCVSTTQLQGLTAKYSKFIVR